MLLKINGTKSFHILFGHFCTFLGKHLLMLSPGFSFLLLLVLLGIKLSKFLVYATYFFISYFFTLFTFKIIFMHYILIRVSPPPTVSTPSPINCIPSRSTVSGSFQVFPVLHCVDALSLM